MSDLHATDTRIPMHLSVPPAVLDRLHAATLRILETTGVRFDTEEAQDVLRKGGVRLEGATAYFKPHQVEWALRVAPRTYDLYDREGHKAYTRGGVGEVRFSPGAGCSYVLDWRTGDVRLYTLADAVEAVKLTDALPQISEASVTGFISDVPGDRVDRYSFVARYQNSSKPMGVGGRSRRAFRAIMDVIIQDVGSLEEIQKRPFCHTGINTFSPLVYDAETCDRLLGGVEYGLPVNVSGWPQLGSTGPVTVAGDVVVAHAEHMAGLVLVQLAREGTRFSTGGSTPVFDMRAMICSTGAPERALGHVLLMQLGRHLGLPVGSSIGTDAKGFSVQSGSERSMLCLSAALAGAETIGGMGWLDNCNVTSPELIVLDCEMAEAVRRFLRSVAVDEEALALETIERVGPAGHFMIEDHTVEHFRKEVWYPSLLERSAQHPPASDDEALRQRVREHVQELLEGHRPPALSAKTQAALKALVE